MLHETDQDRLKQAKAVDAFLIEMRSLPFVGDHWVVEETLRSDTCCWDFDLYYRGLRTGIGEVKCRANDKVTLERVMAEGLYLESERLNKLYKATGGKNRDFDCAIITVLATGRVLYCMLNDLLKFSNDLNTGTGVMADNHGKTKVDKAHTIVPQWLVKDAGWAW